MGYFGPPEATGHSDPGFERSPGDGESRGPASLAGIPEYTGRCTGAGISWCGDWAGAGSGAGIPLRLGLEQKLNRIVAAEPTITAA